MTKFFVMWTGVVEVEAETHKDAVALVKNDPERVLHESQYGASDGITSYSEKPGPMAFS
jgi:hypothetical protein